MTKKRLTILLGAGAAIPWGAPSTQIITDKLLALNNINLTNDENILNFIQKTLAKYHHTEELGRINFENLIYILELLYEYYMEKEQKNPIHFHPDWPGLFEVIHELDSLIPELNIQYMHNATVSHKKGRQIAVYLKTCLQKIFNIVDQYSENFKCSSKINLAFAEMIEELSTNYILRVYTLNYDSILLNLKSNIKFYDGFDKKVGNSYISNYKGIIVNRDDHCFYNVHGNKDYSPSFVSELRFNEYSIVGYNFVFGNDESSIPNFTDVSMTSERKRRLFPSPIISGQQKILHTQVRPFNAIFHSFRQDCMTSDIILSIGYSYSDGHINDCISNAIRDERNISFLNITNDPSLDLELINTPNLGVQFYLRMHNDAGRSFYSNGKNGLAIDENGQDSIYYYGFEKFLEEEVWRKIPLAPGL
jgi:hypothetical protein